MLLPITQNQKDVFEVFANYYLEHEYPPTSREVSEVLSKKAVSNEVLSLIKKGWLTRIEGMSVRAVLPTDEALAKHKSRVA